VEITVQSDERLTIDTPEQVPLELPLAGIGSRFLAVAVDTVLQAALYLTGFLAIMFVSRVVAGLPGLLALIAFAGPALFLLFAFCIYWGYFAFFETVWSGRTPGKRVANIRVIKESGHPINVYEAIGRNVLRAIDFLPFMYGVGVVVMMLNRHSRRVGDFVAGTVVVYDTPTDQLAPSWGSGTAGGGPSVPMTNITAEELQLIEAYLQRRADLDAWVRHQMGEKIVRRVIEKTGVKPEANQSVDEFLERIARSVRDGARFR
jgi:uncharacterized RDD family membrane protein YckC